MSAPGDITPVVYWRAVADEQFADPSTREHMNLGVTAGPLSNHYKATVERFAEPTRATARRWPAIFDTVLNAHTRGALAALQIGSTQAGDTH